jgi:hypothetical protein
MSDLTPSSIASPTPTPSGKSKTGLYIGLSIFIIVVFVSAGVGIYFLTKSQSGSSTGSTTSGDKKTDTSGDKKKDTSGDKKKDKCTGSCDSKANCTCPKGTECDSISNTCKSTNNPVTPATPGTYTAVPNTTSGTKAGCIYTPGLTTSDSNEEAIKRTCDMDPKCVGYYSNSAQNGWKIATQTLPSDCKDFSMTPNGGYDSWRSKSTNYSSVPNTTSGTKAGCIYTPSLTTSDSNEEAIKRTCDMDPKCVGYYSNSAQNGWKIATQTLPSDCKDFSMTPNGGYNNFMKKS